jgi:5'-nucleotidase
VILVTNDDGVASPGLVALREALAGLDRVTVVAPASDRSGWGTLGAEDRIRAVEVELADGSPALAVDGSPADCVRVAASGVLGAVPSLVVSGINLGANVGSSVSVSGTLAAALQAAMLGIPAMAVSQERSRDGAGEWDFRAAQAAAASVAASLLELEPGGVALNVNAPGLPPERVRGLSITTLAPPAPATGEDGSTRDGAGRHSLSLASHARDDTDVAALARGEVSVTPVRLAPVDLPLTAPGDPARSGGSPGAQA